LDVIVKMNPPMLGKERLEHLLYDVLGYTELKVNPTAYTSGLLFDESLGLCRRLTDFAKQRGKKFGAKFSNTLEVLNHRDFFTKENQVQYLSGQPLHVITMTLTDVWRQAVGPDVPISFSAGIDRQNFPLAAACGFAPITTCSDLLKPGGYGRLPPYLETLSKEMAKVGAKTIDEYILRAFGNEKMSVKEAALANTTLVAEKARQDPRYRAPQNRKVPNRIDSHLKTFDCITCDKCIPVCPNAANFTYPTPKVAFDFFDLKFDGTTAAPTGESRHFEIKEEMQIANDAEFCNECGNCDTFCPEYGGPYIKKPGFYRSYESYKSAAPRDGFIVKDDGPTHSILGRIKSKEYHLTFDPRSNHYILRDFGVTCILSAADHSVIACWGHSNFAGQVLDMGIYHTLRHLLHGLLDQRVIHQVNVGSGALIGCERPNTTNS